jgi:hypothetical protein
MTDDEARRDPATAGRRRPLLWAALAAAITFVSIIGLWYRQQADTAALSSATSAAGLIIESQAKGTSLTAVGRTHGLDEPCTAWLVDVRAEASSPAYAVTTGRCVGLTDTMTVLMGEPVDGASIDFNAFAPLTTAVLPNLVTTSIDEVVWASSRGTDLAILQLGSTYGELSQQGVDPISLAAPPGAGERILTAGVPVQTVPEDQQYLRATTCSAGKPADVVEDVWWWPGMVTSDCQGILMGSWGSPALNPAGEARAMVITTSLGAQDGACGPGAPCEVHGAQVALVPGITYLTPVAELEACFPQGTFTLGGGCPLEDPVGVTPASGPRVAAPGTTAEVRLDRRLAAPELVSEKHGPLGSTDCAARAGWSDAMPARDWELDLPMPQQGWMLVCVGSPEQPTPVVIQVDPGN